jgi:hypothetical protein
MCSKNNSKCEKYRLFTRVHLNSPKVPCKGYKWAMKDAKLKCFMRTKLLKNESKVAFKNSYTFKNIFKNQSPLDG